MKNWHILHFPNKTCSRLFVAASFIFLLPPFSPTRSASFAQERGASMILEITSPSFPSGGTIDKKFTCDGADLSPQLLWKNVSSGAKSLALLADDPDAPVGNWNHWTVWNIPANSHGLPTGVSREPKLPDGTEQGKNDFHKTGYNGPCPPPGKPHRYYFKLFALDTSLQLKPSAGRKQLEAAMNGHVLAQTEWMGMYGR